MILDFYDKIVSKIDEMVEKKYIYSISTYNDEQMKMILKELGMFDEKESDEHFFTGKVFEFDGEKIITYNDQYRKHEDNIIITNNDKCFKINSVTCKENKFLPNNKINKSDEQYYRKTTSVYLNNKFNIEMTSIYCITQADKASNKYEKNFIYEKLLKASNDDYLDLISNHETEKYEILYFLNCPISVKYNNIQYNRTMSKKIIDKANNEIEQVFENIFKNNNTKVYRKIVIN